MKYVVKQLAIKLSVFLKNYLSFYCTVNIKNPSVQNAVKFAQCLLFSLFKIYHFHEKLHWVLLAFTWYALKRQQQQQSMTSVLPLHSKKFHYCLSLVQGCATLLLSLVEITKPCTSWVKNNILQKRDVCYSIICFPS